MKKSVYVLSVVLASALFLGIPVAVNAAHPLESKRMLLKILGERADSVKRFETLEHDLGHLQEETVHLQQLVAQLTQEIAEVKKIEATLHQKPALYVWAKAIKKTAAFRVLSDPRVSLGLMMLVVLLLVWKFSPSRSRSKVKKESPEIKAPREETQQPAYSAYNFNIDQPEYPFSADAIPTRLNLAHAYIAMEDYLAARRILEEVAEKGSSAQQAEAQKLLSTFAPS